MTSSGIPNGGESSGNATPVRGPSPRASALDDGESMEELFESVEDSTRSSPWQLAPSLVEIDTETNQVHEHFAGLDWNTLLQAVVFIEDAYKYRSICHKIEAHVLRLYRNYLSKPVDIFRYAVIFVLHILVIFEYPSSLTKTSDIRFRDSRLIVPCLVTEGIELLCLLLLLGDTIIRGYLLGEYYFRRHKWLVACICVLTVSLVDWTVSVSLGCHEYIRFRRILRPFFILQNSAIMKKIVNCLRRTLPEVVRYSLSLGISLGFISMFLVSVLVLLGIHIYIFTLFAMLLFPEIQTQKGNTATASYQDDGNATTTEKSMYFRTLLDSFMKLLVLLTTANNPDVTMPAYQNNRIYAFFFIAFLIIGLYCFMNMLTAVIFNQFRGYFLNSMQASLFRRRLGVLAAFEVLRCRKMAFHHNSSLETTSVEIGAPVIKALVEKAFLSTIVKHALLEEIAKKPDATYSATEFQELFEELKRKHEHKQKPAVRWFLNPVLRQIQEVFVHKYFAYFGSVIASANVIVISVQLDTRYDESISTSNSVLRITNFTFVIYYVLEQIVNIWANGIRRYVCFKCNIFDAIVTLALVVGEIFTIVKAGVPYIEGRGSATDSTLWNAVRFINIIIIVRLLRIIPHIKATSVIVSTLIDLMKNLKAFAGIIVVIYYSFAIFGMELFHDVIKYDGIVENMSTISNATYQCGTYRQLGFWANNFDDFAASVIVLWDIMVVNNWMVFLNVYKKETSAWSYLFFITWWLLSVVVILNIFTALILENFIMKWDKSRRTSDQSAFSRIEESSYLMSIHQMFRYLLQEPAENELLVELSSHRYMQLDR